PLLRVVGRLGVGLDNIDVEACRRRGIEVIPATGANARAVAEYVLAAALLLLRPALLASAEVAAGGWPRSRLSQGRELAGKTLGLIGCGSIGQATAVLARALGLEVCGFDPVLPTDSASWSRITRLELPALLSRADVVSLHVPLTETTRGLFGEKTI